MKKAIVVLMGLFVMVGLVSAMLEPAITATVHIPDADGSALKYIRIKPDGWLGYSSTEQRIEFDENLGRIKFYGATLFIDPNADPLSSPVKGDLYADTDGELYFYDGVGWVDLTAGAGGGDSWGDAVDADILPTGNDNTYDLGSVAASFADGFFEGTLEGATITEGGKAIYNADEIETALTVGGSDTLFPADPDADRILMWDDDPGALVWSAAGTGDLLANGTIPLTANWDVGAFTITGTQFISDIAEGTAPFVVTSPTQVANLNAATAGTATLATTITMADDDATNDNHDILFTTDAAGAVNAEADIGDLYYNPYSGILFSPEFSGGGAALTAVDAATGDSATDFFDAGEIADARISDTLTSSSCTGTADIATHVTVTDNEDQSEENEVAFVEDASAPGNVGLESDSGFTYNPSTGTLTAAEFSGGGANLTAVDAATGDSATDFFDAGEIADNRISDTLTSSSCTGNAATVTNATLTTALTVDTGTLTLTANGANNSVLTIGAGAVSVSGTTSGTNTGDNTVATSGDSATDFFGEGEIADARISDTLTSSSCTGNAATVTTNANLTGEVTSVGNAATIADTITVTGWTMGASAATTPAGDDADTSLATTAFCETTQDYLKTAELTAAALEAALTNDAIDFGTGVVTAAGFTLGQDENITLNSQTIDHDNTDFVFTDSINLGANALKTTANIAGKPEHLRFNFFDPLALQTADTQVCIWPLTDAAITITNIKITLDAAGNEVIGDLMFADTFIGLGTPTVINICDTSSGVINDSAMGDGTVPSGKCIYFQFDSAPHTDITQMSWDITFDYD